MHSMIRSQVKSRRGQRRKEYGEHDAEPHHLSCSMELPALRNFKEARGVVTLPSSHLHAEALTSGAAFAVAVGTCSADSFGTSEVPLMSAGPSFADDAAAAEPSVASAMGAASVVVWSGSVCVSSDLTALLGLRNRPPSFCGSGDFFVSPSVTSVSEVGSPDFLSFLLLKLLKIDVRRLSFRGAFPSELGATGESETVLVCVSVGDVICSSVFASFLGCGNVSYVRIRFPSPRTSTLESCLLKKPITPPLCDGVVGLLVVAGPVVV
jgi:hypothetical protein